MPSDPTPLPAYASRLLEAAVEAGNRHWGAAAAILDALEPDTALATLAAMYSELVHHYERDVQLQPGEYLEKLRSQYRVAELLGEVGAAPIQPEPAESRLTLDYGDALK